MREREQSGKEWERGGERGEKVASHHRRFLPFSRGRIVRKVAWEFEARMRVCAVDFYPHPRLERGEEGGRKNRSDDDFSGFSLPSFRGVPRFDKRGRTTTKKSSFMLSFLHSNLPFPIPVQARRWRQVVNDQVSWGSKVSEESLPNLRQVSLRPPFLPEWKRETGRWYRRRRTRGGRFCRRLAA